MSDKLSLALFSILFFFSSLFLFVIDTNVQMTDKSAEHTLDFIIFCSFILFGVFFSSCSRSDGISVAHKRTRKSIELQTVTPPLAKCSTQIRFFPLFFHFDLRCFAHILGTQSALTSKRLRYTVKRSAIHQF